MKKYSKNKTYKKKNRTYYTQKIKSDYPDKKNRKKLIQEFILFLNNKKRKKNTKNLFKFQDQIDLLKICFAADKSLEKKKEVEIIY